MRNVWCAPSETIYRLAEALYDPDLSLPGAMMNPRCCGCAILRTIPAHIPAPRPEVSTK